MAPRKTFLLRLPPELWDELNRLAKDELRSVNAQIEYIIRDALRQRGRKQNDDDSPATDGSDE